MPITRFGDFCLGQSIRTLAVFGDSITVGEGATNPDRSWARLMAKRLGVELANAAISGTVLQGSLMADGRPRPGNGISRYRDALLGNARADALVVLYGYNDARYTAAPETFNLAAFVRDYRAILADLVPAYGNALCLGSPPFIPTIGFAKGGHGFTNQSRPGFAAFATAVRALATEFHTFYAPVYESMATHPDGSLASPDITHPNDLGHAVIAEAVLAAERL